MDTIAFIQRIEGAGFSLALIDGNLAIRPASDLNDKQRAFIRSHKAEILAELQDRVTIHVPEFELQTGQRVSFDMTVPRANLQALRQTLRFELKDNQGGGSVLGAPGVTQNELRRILDEKYGVRIESIG